MGHPRRDDLFAHLLGGRHAQRPRRLDLGRAAPADAAHRDLREGLREDQRVHRQRPEGRREGEGEGLDAAPARKQPRGRGALSGAQAERSPLVQHLQGRVRGPLHLPQRVRQARGGDVHAQFPDRPGHLRRPRLHGQRRAGRAHERAARDARRGHGRARSDGDAPRRLPLAGAGRMALRLRRGRGGAGEGLPAHDEDGLQGRGLSGERALAFGEVGDRATAGSSSGTTRTSSPATRSG